MKVILGESNARQSLLLAEVLLTKGLADHRGAGYGGEHLITLKL